MRSVRIHMSDDLVRQLFHMPESVEIVASTVVNDGGYRWIEFTLESPAFPQVPEGEETPLVHPTVTHHVDDYEWDWGIPTADAAP